MQTAISYQPDLFIEARKARQAHAKTLHGQSVNFVCVSIRKNNKSQTLKSEFVRGVDLPFWVEEYAPFLVKDAFISQNRFDKQRRRIQDLIEFGACFSDIDYYNTYRYENVAPEKVFDDIQNDLQANGYPEPSFAIDTGRGLAIIWLLKSGYDIGHLHKWHNVQKDIYAILKEYGSDRSSTDGARILRLAGSENTKANRIVKVIYNNETVYNLNNFPESKADLDTTQTEQAKNTWLEKSLWNRRLKDLLKLPNTYGGKIPTGTRHNWLAITYIALAWLDAARYWQREKGGLIKYTSGEYSKADLEATLRTLDRRQKESYGKNKGLYKFKTKTIQEWLNISKDYCIKNGLYCLAGNQWLHGQERNEYERETRRRKGIKERSEYLQKVTKTEQRKAIIDMRQKGMSWRKIAHEIDVSQARIRQIYKSLGV